VKRYLNPTLEIEIRSEYLPIQQSNNGRQDKHKQTRDSSNASQQRPKFGLPNAEDNKELNSSGAPHHTAITFQETTNTWKRISGIETNMDTTTERPHENNSSLNQLGRITG
jgi:hypothetical protein